MKTQFPLIRSAILLAVLGLVLLLTFPQVAAQSPAPTFREISRIGRGTADDIAWRPDGQEFAVVGTHGLWIYDTQMQLLQHIDGVNLRRAAWSPDGARIASIGGRTVDGGYDLRDSLLVWDVTSANLIHTLFTQEQNTWLINLDWNPDGRRIAVSGNGGLWIYDTETAALISTLKSPGALAWSPDGKLLATVANTLSIYADNGSLVSSLPVTNINDVSWSPDGQMLAVARGSSFFSDVDNTLQIWDASDKQPSLIMQAGEIRSVDWSPDGYRLASGTASNVNDPNFVQVWNRANGMLLAKLFAGDVPGDNGSLILRPVTVRWAPDSQHLLAAGGDNIVRLWNLPEGDANVSVEEGILVDHSGPAYALAFSPDGYTIASGGNDGALRLWPSDGTGSARLVTTSAGKVRGLTWSKSGRYIAMSTTGIDTEFQVIDTQTLDVVDERSVEFTHPGETSELGLNMIGFNADESLVQWASQGNQAGLEDFNNGVTVATLNLSKLSIPAMAWSPDGKTLAGFEGVQRGVVVWDNSGKSLRCLGCPYDNEIVTQLGWSPDSQMLAVVPSEDPSGGLRMSIWNTRTGALVMTLPREIEDILALDWSSRGQIAIVTRNEVKIWDTASGKLLTSLEVPGAQAVAWSADGKQLAVATGGGTIRIWASD